MKRASLLFALTVALTAISPAAAQPASSEYVTAEPSNATTDSTVVAYRRAGCSCCSKWAAHLEDNGFAVDLTGRSDMTPVKDEAGVPSRLRSCHTAFVGGYVVEGHVPADVIKRMLREQPDVAGIAVPGMPIGSPGMEMPGREAESYEVVAFTESDSTYVYARR